MVANKIVDELALLGALQEFHKDYNHLMCDVNKSPLVVSNKISCVVTDRLLDSIVIRLQCCP